MRKKREIEKKEILLNFEKTKISLNKNNIFPPFLNISKIDFFGSLI